MTAIMIESTTAYLLLPISI